MAIQVYQRAASVKEALDSSVSSAADGRELRRAYVGGGTELVPLMRAGIVDPQHVVDLRFAGLSSIAAAHAGESIVIGAAATMRAVAADSVIRRDYPVLAQALLESASPQIRNVATIGGNLLQRTRCIFFRDVAFPCNKRQPGSGCPAQQHAEDWRFALVGGSDACRAVHPSDCAVALTSLDARVNLHGPAGIREVPLSEFYVDPGSTPWRETILGDRELITAIECPFRAPASAYVKVRHRASFEFAIVSAAAVVRQTATGRPQVGLVVGGVAPRPWRLREMEDALANRPLTRRAIERAVETIFQAHRDIPHSEFKVTLVRRAAERALLIAGGLI
jgi:xanthine dehydrogenase YagS FAD-binding subunit